MRPHKAVVGPWSADDCLLFASRFGTRIPDQGAYRAVYIISLRCAVFLDSCYWKAQAGLDK